MAIYHSFCDSLEPATPLSRYALSSFCPVQDFSANKGQACLLRLPAKWLHLCPTQLCHTEP
jgi:hypothetical protein